MINLIRNLNKKSMELTKEHFDQSVKGLATQQSLNQMADDLKDVKKTVNSHTSALDAISANTQSWTIEKAAMTGRMNRHAEAIRLLAEKLGVKLENFDVA